MSNDSRVTNRTLTNVVVHWASVNTSQNKYDSDEKEWAVTVEISDKQLAELKQLGFSRKTRDIDGKTCIQFTKNCASRDGTELFKPEVNDRYGNAYDGLVGNGSVCDVAVRIFEYKPGRFMFSYDGIRITSLVEYIAPTDDGEEVKKSSKFKFDKKEEKKLEGKPLGGDDVDLSDLEI